MVLTSAPSSRRIETISGRAAAAAAISADRPLASVAPTLAPARSSARKSAGGVPTAAAAAKMGVARSVARASSGSARARRSISAQPA